jgi:bifunctional NMN adenylyltransferase/nudix hydrolase
MEKFDFGVYIGRFEPFHVAHLASVKFALERCETLIVVIGSCNKPRTTKNPWTAAERGAMILNSLTCHLHKQVTYSHHYSFGAS